MSALGGKALDNADTETQDHATREAATSESPPDGSTAAAIGTAADALVEAGKDSDSDSTVLTDTVVIQPQADAPQLPPRRSAATQASDGTAVNDEQSSATGCDNAPIHPLDDSDDSPLAIDDGPLRIGSPFAEAQAAPVEVATQRYVAPPSYPRHAAAVGGAIASALLGVMSLSIAILFTEFPPVAIFLSLLGIGMGTWGLYSTRRGMAALGVMLCVIAFGTASFYGAVRMYEMIHGVSPWATDVVDEEDETINSADY